MIDSHKVLKALIRSLLDKAGLVDVDFVENHLIPELNRQGYSITKLRAKCKSK